MAVYSGKFLIYDYNVAVWYHVVVVGYQKHHSDPATTPLATRATARTVQDRCPRFSVFSRPSTVILVKRL